MRVVRIGVVGQNLINTKSVSEAPRKVGFGLTAILGKVEISFDTDLDLQTAPEQQAHALLRVRHPGAAGRLGGDAHRLRARTTSWTRSA
jgi:hypothetical protein